jgi:hypothetical protein
MSLRDGFRERRLLAAAARGHEPFVRHAEARLEAGQEPFGDSWAWFGMPRHLRELLEEAADLGAWAVLADQALDRDPHLSHLHREQLRAVLAIAARRGAQAHEALTRALESVTP